MRWTHAIVLFLVTLTLTHSNAAAQGLWAGGKMLAGFPLMTQPDDISCGPTCAAMVLKYYGRSAGIGGLKTKAGTRWFSFQKVRIGMTHPKKLTEAILGYGLHAARYRAALDDLVRFVNEDRPPIVLVRSGSDTWHYVVVIGHTDGKKYFQIADPGGYKYWMTGSDLDAAWRYSHALGNFKRDRRFGNLRQVSAVGGRQCRTCGGAGKIAKGSTKCLVCSGTGNISGTIFGRKVNTTCTACSGRGVYSSKGVRCVVCSGDGRETDFYRKAVESFGAHGHTMVLPARRQATNSNVNTSSGKASSAKGISYTIVNKSDRRVKFRLPSGKDYTLQPGEKRSYSNPAKQRPWKIYVYRTRRSYNLVSGDHKFFWYAKENRIGFDKNYRR